MVAHCRVAHETGVKSENIMIAENGNVVFVNDKKMEVIDRVPANPVMIDGKNVGDVEFSVIDERRKLSKEGVVNAVFLIDRRRKELITEPSIETKGFLSDKFSAKFISETKNEVKKVIQKWASDKGSRKDLERDIRSFLAGIILRETHRNPIIFVSVLEA